MKTCKHSNCAVCVSTKIKERDVFKSILKTVYPEIYICENARYKIINNNGDEFMITSLEFASITEKGCFVKDMFTSGIIYLNNKNVEVMCIAEGECNLEPYVLEYNPRQKRGS